MNGENNLSEYILEANEISKRADEREILRNVSLNLRRGETVSVLGSKNSGKTTLMRILAGFDAPSSGSVMSEGKSLTRTAPYKRGMCSVFSDSALFPNMTVSENLSYPLKIRGYSSEQTREILRCALDISLLKGCEKKHPSELTAVQNKRAVIARAAVCSPDVLLLDEPFIPFLSNERTAALEMVRDLKKEFELSVICATADPEVSMQLSDRVFILRSGKTEQSGPPSYLYSKPRTSFAAQLLGKANIIKGRAASTGEFITVDTGGALISVYNSNYPVREGMPVTMCIRPENLILSTRPVGNSVKGVIVEQIFSSASTTIRIKSGTVELFCTTTGMSRFDEGDTVYVEFDPRQTLLIDLTQAND